MDFQKVSKRVLRVLKLPPQLLYALGVGRWYGRLVLLLTTQGRKSGMPRVTPLQYEVIDGLYYLGSSLGEKADWYRNIQANPQVELRVGERHIQGFAETTTDPERLVDFLLYRLKQHPRMIGTILRAEGVPANAGREELKRYVARLALVIVHPQEQ